MNNVDALIERLVEQYYAYLLRVAASFVHDSQMAEDIVQDAFVTAFTQLDHVYEATNFKAWLSTIVVNRCRDQLRKQTRRARLRHFLRLGVADSAEVLTARKEQSTELWQAVDALNEKHRLPIILRYANNLSVREIAEILHEKEGTIHSRLHYGRRKLGERLPVGVVAYE